ncbi:metal-dependent hydrolase [Haloplanus pelagicus]|uniref:metal-dependent hydrolase n=1 Tax=Haloplanus pelagicus TaxID=2949995 RepID=UPI00211149EB|nr:metal-dependent hydrolase [Haloplanus sp. HW8-1]
MLPWGHLAVGYLGYTVLTRARTRRPPAGVPVLVLAVATQLPDLVDKPLNWWFGVFDGRGIGHSLVAVAVVCLLAVLVARRYDRPALTGALSIGLFSHLCADAWRPLVAGRFERATFLLWPLLPVPTYSTDSLGGHLGSWLAHLRLLPVSPLEFLTSGFGVQLALFSVVFGVWGLDGFPGLGTTRRLLTRRSSDSTVDTER